MNKNELLNSVLGMLRLIKDDKEKLQHIYNFMCDEIIENEDIRNVEIEIPEKYKSLVHDIAESIDCGLICFVNPKTLELINILQDTYYLDDDLYQESLNRIDEWEEFIKFEPLPSNEGFQIMSNFTQYLPEGRFKNSVINALNNRRPFANFKNLIESSKYRQDWFAFKQKQIEIAVYQNLIS